MGIARFFNTLKTFSHTKQSITKITKPIDIKYLFLDFNAIMHPNKDIILKKLNLQLEQYLVNNQINDETNIQDYCDKLQLNIDELIQDSIMKYVKNLANVAISNLDTLYISIDGTPSIAKMIEQKKRRFMGKLFEIIKIQLIEKYKNQLSKQSTKLKYNNRYLLEKYTIRWSASNLAPGTNFMINFSTNLKKSEYISKYIQPKKFIFSNFTTVGEGEKKIINYIIKNIPNEEIMIYSPDADVILLSMLLPNKNVYIIREDDRSDGFLVVNINKLNHSFYNLFKKYSIKKHQLHHFIRDIIFLFTFFGDDFVPAIESYTIGNHILHIIKAYALGYNKFGDLTTDTTINNECLTYILNLLTKNDLENYILVEKYLFGYYKSYGFLRKNFNNWCDKNNLDVTTFIFPNIVKQCIKMHYYLNKNLNNKGESFISEMRKFGKNIKLVINILYNVFLEYDGDGIDGIINLHKQNRQLPPLNLQLKKNNLNEAIQMASRGKPFNMLPLNLQLIKDNSHYDTLVFGIEKMIDIRDKIPGINWNSYFERSSNDLYQLGYVDIPSSENKFEYNIDKYATKMNTLFKKYQFGKEDAIKSYLDGIMWTFYYYNSKTDIGMSSWFYDFRKAPLLTDICIYLKNGYDINKSSETYNKHYVPKNYFTPYEQALFITPTEDFDILPENILAIFKKSSKLMNYLQKNNPNLHDIAKHIIDYKKPNPLNCKDEMFFNKCTIKNSDDIKTELQELVKELPLEDEHMNTSKLNEVCEFSN
jgi:5'-3' exonuclease